MEPLLKMDPLAMPSPFDGPRPTQRVLRPLDIDFTDITYTVPAGIETKPVLKGVSGTFKAGELTAIMGPSGAGKTSLLNVLTGFLSEGMKGSVRVNGVERNLSTFRKSSCYILQSDQLHPHFTVLETMDMAANLKLGPGVGKKARKIEVDNVLDRLGLQACANTRASELSGGQQKRLSIGLELLDNPPIMFLDEPTTGLDSSSCTSCVKLLRSLASQGRTIVCTIHQPSASLWEMFDHVYVLAEGKCVYQGDSIQAVSFLDGLGISCPLYHNPADFILEVTNGDLFSNGSLISKSDHQLILQKMGEASKTDKWRRKTFRHFHQNTLLEKPGIFSVLRAQKQGVSEWSKFSILTGRFTKQFLRDWTMTYLKLIFHVLVGIVLGLLYQGSGQDGARSIANMGFFLVTLVYLAYTSMMPAVLRFPPEMNVVRKERFNNWYSLRTYYAAFTVVDTPLQLLFCSSYVLVSYFLSSQSLEPFRVVMFVSICLITSLVAETVGLVLGALCSPKVGTFAGAYSTALWIVLSGFLLLHDHIPYVLRWMPFISYLHYGFEGLAITQYGFGRGTLECPMDDYCHYKYPKALLAELSVNPDNYWLDFGILSGFLVVLRIISYWALKKKLNSLNCK
ncbi:ATP-binding cassette sub-family G member 1 [Cloeon dipterum]|uniref:ATP-binding cassette sub-family G member 1 n=1 Tax=Cloeon dipterum TaxID=197152 RepID=UPI00321FA73E